MKQFSYLATLTIAAVSMVSCSNDVEEQVKINTKSNALTFAPYVNMHTRALDKSSFVANDAFRLNACLTEGANLDANFTNNFMENAIVTKQSDGIWTYNDAKFWPENASDRISFVASYPDSVEPDFTDGTVSWHFGVAANPEQQTDFMWSSITDAHRNDRNGGYQNGLIEKPNTTPVTNVPLHFQHALSRISFRAAATNTYQGATVKIMGITVNGLKASGTYALNKELGQGTWTADEGDLVSYTALADGNLSVSTKGYAVCGQSLLLMPQTLDESATVTITYDVTYSSPSKTVSESKTFPLAAKTLKDGNTWEQNKTYTYSFGVSLDMITFEATVSGWGNTANDIMVN